MICTEDNVICFPSTGLVSIETDDGCIVEYPCPINPRCDHGLPLTTYLDCYDCQALEAGTGKLFLASIDPLEGAYPATGALTPSQFDDFQHDIVRLDRWVFGKPTIEYAE